MVGKSVLVLGLGVSGRSAAQFLLRQGDHVFGVDSNRDLLAKNEDIQKMQRLGLRVDHESSLKSVQGFDLVVVSPGISPKHPLYAQAVSSGIEVIGEIELAFRYLKGTVIGITGTNGKTTVTLLTAHVLNHCGKRARALGNVGTPLTSECDTEANEIAVVELSSFQLDTLKQHVIDAAVLLNITPDHLERYITMEAYARSKLHIANCLKPNGEFFIENACWKEFGHLLKGKKPKVYGYENSCDIHSDLKHILINSNVESVLPSKLQGKVSHDLENVMASYAVCRHVGVESTQFFEAYASFKKPSHRIEFVRKHNEISFYDDSKGTNIDAVIRAVAILEGPIVLIAGGIDKGAAYTAWIPVFRGKVKKICAIGQAASKIKQDVNSSIPVELFNSLEEAVRHAAKVAQPGDNVLLSPGCSSFDMFLDYADRGKKFQDCVKQIY